MKMQSEASFQILFKGFLKKNPPEGTEVHELKLVREGNFPIAQWILKNPHQARGLMQSKKGGCYHKLSDMSMGLKPFDSFYIKGAEAFLVVFFNEFEKFIMIEVEDAIRLTKEVKTISFDKLKKHGKVYSLPTK